MSIIHLIIIGYTLSLLYVLKNLVLGSLRLYALKHNLGIDPNDFRLAFKNKLTTNTCIL